MTDWDAAYRAAMLQDRADQIADGENPDLLFDPEEPR